MRRKKSPLDALEDASLLRTQALINGEWVAGQSQFAVTDPATGAHLADVANLGAIEAEAAIAAANNAWGPWRSKTAKERAAILLRWHQLLIKHTDDLARIMTAEQGKPLAEARGEVVYGASFIDWFAEEGKRVYGETIPTTDNNKRYLVIKQAMEVGHGRRGGVGARAERRALPVPAPTRSPPPAPSSPRTATPTTSCTP